MATLSLNVDYVAALRQARGGTEPDPVTAAALAELAGVQGITVSLREDRRHIQDRDLRLLRRTIKTRLNLDMAATEEMLGLAGEIRPFRCTLVPEKRRSPAAEGGLDAAGQREALGRAVETLHQGGLLASLFIEPEDRQVQAAKELGAD
ncbi:MAG: pyridoxine 5'-phosphate synthase, partial [Thermodesulfobacteriota bacterium]